MGDPGPPCAAREPLARDPPARSVLRHVRLENLAAGMSGGVLSTLALHPLDLVKIRFAVSDGLELRPKYNGILHCMTTVWKHEGLRGLYQGVTPNMVGAGASWGLYFFFYNAIKAYRKEGKMESLSASEHLVSAAEAGAMTLCITNPIWVTKTRLVLQYNAGVDPSKRQYRGMFDALIKIYKTEGIRGLYKALSFDLHPPDDWGQRCSAAYQAEIKKQLGVMYFEHTCGSVGDLSSKNYFAVKLNVMQPSSCYKWYVVIFKHKVLHRDISISSFHIKDGNIFHHEGIKMIMVTSVSFLHKFEQGTRILQGFVPGLFGTSHGALQFMAYEDLKERYNKYRNRVSDTKLNTVEYIMMAAISKIFAVSATYPYQVVRARLQDQHNTYSGVFDVIRRTWRKEGVHGFYKGIIPNVIRVTPACCITFVVYENVSGFLLGFRKENN